MFIDPSMSLVFLAPIKGEGVLVIDGSGHAAIGRDARLQSNKGAGIAADAGQRGEHDARDRVAHRGIH